MLVAEKVWRQLMKDLKIPQHKWRSEWSRIVEGYSGPRRVYHTLSHIGQVLRHVDRFGSKLLVPAAVRLAAIYHDVADTEEESAQIAAAALKKFGLPADWCDAVRALVLCTKSHKPVTGLLAADSALLSDCDLLILASSWTKYEAYTGKVRREWSQFDDAKFRAGRKEVMEKFLLRQPIYFTLEIREKYEDIARANLEREISQL